MGPNLLVSLCMLDKICIANRAQFRSESFISKVKPLFCNKQLLRKCSCICQFPEVNNRFELFVFKLI